MSLPVRTTREADEDIEDAIRWIEQSSGLVVRFITTLNQVFTRIRQFPESYAIYRRDVRRARIGRTPYSLYYHILADEVEVVAIIHNRRDPSSWQHRI